MTTRLARMARRLALGLWLGPALAVATVVALTLPRTHQA